LLAEHKKNDYCWNVISWKFNLHTFNICLVFGLLGIIVISFATMHLQYAFGIEDQHKMKLIFHSIRINNDHDAGIDDGEWILHGYVNERPMNLSSGTGLAHANEDEIIFNNKFITVDVPPNGTLRTLSVGLEQDNTNTKLPNISSLLKDAIPSITVSGVEIGGKMVAAWYNISQSLINYDTDDPVGILSKAYSLENNFGVGTHSDCSRVNDNVVNVVKQQSTSCDFILNYEIRDLNHKLPIPAWHDWEVMDGIPATVSTPAATSIVPGQFKIVGLDADGGFFLLPYDYGWQEYTLLSTETSNSRYFAPSYSSQPAVISEGPDRTLVFALGSDKSVWYTSFSEEEGKWTKWVNSGGSFVSAPTVLAAAPQLINVYGVGHDNFIWERQFDTKNGKWISDEWAQLSRLGDNFKSSPALVLPRGISNKLDAFALSKNDSIWHGTYDAVTRGGPWPFPVTINWALKNVEYLTNNSKFISQPVAVETGYGKISLFAQTGDNQLVKKTYNYFDRAWSEINWDTLGKIFSNPVVATPSSHRIDIFAQNGTSLIHKWFGN
jgi:hypothetical protein